MAKTLEELAKQVEQGQSGLTNLDDLVALFAEEPTQEQPPITEQQVVAAPVTASTAQAPNPETTPPVSAGQGEPNEDPLKNVPDKFKGKDLSSSLEKTVQSYLALEQANTKSQEELLRLRELVENLSKSVPQTQVQQPNAQDVKPEEVDEFADIDDVAILERPREILLKLRESIRKENAKMAAQAIGQYHQMQVDQLQRSQMIEQFKSSHPDFDSYVEDMRAVIQQRPDLNQRTDSLPMIYELGKQRFQKRISTMKTQLGVAEPTPTFTEEMKQSLLAEATEKAKREILEEVRKRRAASGTLPGSTPNTMQGIMEEKPKEKAMTEDEKVFDAMMNSGPNKPGWEK